MTHILCFETATECCSVAISANTECLACEEVAEGHSHSEKVLELTGKCLDTAGLGFKDVDAICISGGPGSYTGLRIGTSTVKGLCYALSKPLIAVPTLEGIACGARAAYPGMELYCPMIDARRMEVFCAVYDAQGNILKECGSLIIGTDSFLEERMSHSILFCGNGAEKCNGLLSSERSICITTRASAKNLIPAAYSRWMQRHFEDTAYYEPFYLKEYVAAKPHVKGLHD